MELPAGIIGSASTTSVYVFAVSKMGIVDKLIINEDMTDIPSNTFRSMYIKTVEFPSSLKTIGVSAFSSCNVLTAIDLPSTITDISNGAFSYCSNLEEITVRATTPPSLSPTSLNNVPADCAIYVPSESVSAYKAASNWKTRADYIQAIPTE